MEEKLARIDATWLGFEDHGIFTALLTLNFGHSGQGAGGYNLSGDRTAYKFISGVLRVLQVERWEDVQGHSVIALLDGSGVVGLKSLPFVSDEVFLFESINGGES